MDERRLRYFLAIVEDGSVTAAAARLHVAQPSLSQSLRSIERELGAELFHRVGRGLRLTSAGRALIGPARQALLAIDAARSAVREISDVLAGELAVAALATLAADPLADLVGSFRQAYPGVTVEIGEAESTADASRLVAEGTRELGLVQLPAPRQLVASALGRQELMFVLPPGREPSERPLTPTALRSVPLVVTPPGTSTRDLLELAFASAAVVPQIAVETTAREAIVPLVLAGAGAALLPAGLAREASRRGAAVRPARPPLTRPIGLVSRPGTLSPAARAFTALALADGEPPKTTTALD
ncbi:MAG TPA: LysR substrate-binding domain-containing protein [Solirubrobacteraceae bacterium]